MARPTADGAIVAVAASIGWVSDHSSENLPFNSAKAYLVTIAVSPLYTGVKSTTAPGAPPHRAPNVSRRHRK
jgi:hypothetical protein